MKIGSFPSTDNPNRAEKTGSSCTTKDDNQNNELWGKDPSFQSILDKGTSHGHNCRDERHFHPGHPLQFGNEHTQNTDRIESYPGKPADDGGDFEENGFPLEDVGFLEQVEPTSEKRKIGCSCFVKRIKLLFGSF